MTKSFGLREAGGEPRLAIFGTIRVRGMKRKFTKRVAGFRWCASALSLGLAVLRVQSAGSCRHVTDLACGHSCSAGQWNRRASREPAGDR